jgi:hypothetical protein
LRRDAADALRTQPAREPVRRVRWTVPAPRPDPPVLLPALLACVGGVGSGPRRDAEGAAAVVRAVARRPGDDELRRRRREVRVSDNAVRKWLQRDEEKAGL